MSIYRYSDSLVDEVTIRRSKQSKGDIGYLHARSDARPDELAALREALHHEGWQVVPFQFDGQPTLQVRGFKTEDKLFEYLGQRGHIRGTPRIEKTENDRITTKEKLKKGTLQASGAFYVLGDAGYTTYGYKGSNAWNIFAGLFYFLGSASLLRYGRRDQSEPQVKNIAEKINRFLYNEKVTMPDDCALKEITKDKDKGVLHKIENFFSRYPAEMMNIFFTVAGLCIIASVFGELKELGKKSVEYSQMLKKGIANPAEKKFIEKELKEIPHHYAAKYLDIGLGSLTAASGLTSAFMKEKSPDPTKPKRKGLAGVWDWVREKPLRIAGYGYIGSTLCHAVSTTIEINKSNQFIKEYGGVSASQFGATAKDFSGALDNAISKKKSLPFRALFVGANLIAEFLMSISSKGHGEGVKSDGGVERSVYAIAADAIARQNPDLQPQLVERMSGMLAAADVIGGSAAMHVAGIMEQLNGIRANPWVMAGYAGKESDASHALPAANMIRHDAPAKPWSDRVLQPAALAAQPSL